MLRWATLRYAVLCRAVLHCVLRAAHCVMRAACRVLRAACCALRAGCCAVLRCAMLHDAIMN
eukprot:5919575-Lingulodinium_polyedra.AAC.1